MDTQQCNETIAKWMRDSKITASNGQVPSDFKKIINGITYNTKTASYITSFYKTDCPQYEQFDERLYQTPKGYFFLVGAGYEYTPYSGEIPNTNNRMFGHALVPLSESIAKNWLLMRGLDDEYEEIFGKTTEYCSGRLVIKMAPFILDKLQAKAELENSTMQDLVKRLIESHVSN